VDLAVPFLRGARRTPTLKSGWRSFRAALRALRLAKMLVVL